MDNSAFGKLWRAKENAERLNLQQQKEEENICLQSQTPQIYSPKIYLE